MSDSETELGIEDLLPGGGSESETEEQTSMSTSPDKSGDEAKPKITDKVEDEETDKKSKPEDGSSRFKKFNEYLSKPRSLGLSYKQIALAALLAGVIFPSISFGVSFIIFLQKIVELTLLFYVTFITVRCWLDVFWISNGSTLK